MPTRIIVFNVVQLLACAYAVWRGGAPERWTAAMMAIAAGLSAAAIYELGIPMTTIRAFSGRPESRGIHTGALI